jgi:PIN domain nuclease of toxin-antitoxin system
LIVLDTHVLIWFVQGDTRLGGHARSVMYEQVLSGDLLIPAIVFWEVALIAGRGKVVLDMDTLPWSRRVLTLPGFKMVPLELEISVSSNALRWDHRDPVDRQVVATAQHWQAPVLTADHQILAYANAGHVQAIDARR